MCVLSGDGQHHVAGECSLLQEGMLLLVRPHDAHTFRASPGVPTVFINIAFPVDIWQQWVRAAGLETEAAAWAQASLPPAILMAENAHRETAAAFQRALQAYQDGPTRLELCRLWAACIPRLREGTSPLPPPAVAGPVWLARACRAMGEAHNLRGGGPRLAALSGVSTTHLARTLKQHTGKTPTEFVNTLRLTRAALLLATTSEEILVIADDCGFENLSYFYRLFRRKYGLPPQAYRVQAHHDVVP